MRWICSASKGKPEGYSNVRGKPAGLKDSKSPTRWLQELLLVCVGLLRSSSRVFSLVCTPQVGCLIRADDSGISFLTVAPPQSVLLERVNLKCKAHTSRADFSTKSPTCLFEISYGVSPCRSVLVVAKKSLQGGFGGWNISSYFLAAKGPFAAAGMAPSWAHNFICFLAKGFLKSKRVWVCFVRLSPSSRNILSDSSSRAVAPVVCGGVRTYRAVLPF